MYPYVPRKRISHKRIPSLDHSNTRRGISQYSPHLRFHRIQQQANRFQHLSDINIRRLFTSSNLIHRSFEAAMTGFSKLSAVALATCVADVGALSMFADYFKKTEKKTHSGMTRCSSPESTNLLNMGRSA